MTLARKQSSVHEDWLAPLAAAYSDPDLDRAERLVHMAAQRVRQAQHDLCLRRLAFGWSGGKDSQGLRVVAEAAGITDSVLVISELEYPAFLAWATDYLPWGCTVWTVPLDLAWLAAHQDWLFPPDARTAGRWFKAVQHTGQRAYMGAGRWDGLVIGRRRADGNHCGPDGIYRDPAGFFRLSPMFDWTHEDLLCVLGAYRMPLPPCYGWPRGFRVGTGPWPARQWCGTIARGWAEVMQIDETVVELAADAGLLGAREAMSCAG